MTSRPAPSVVPAVVERPPVGAVLDSVKAKLAANRRCTPVAGCVGIAPGTAGHVRATEQAGFIAGRLTDIHGLGAKKGVGHRQSRVGVGHVVVVVVMVVRHIFE